MVRFGSVRLVSHRPLEFTATREQATVRFRARIAENLFEGQATYDSPADAEAVKEDWENRRTASLTEAFGGRTLNATTVHGMHLFVERCCS